MTTTKTPQRRADYALTLLYKMLDEIEIGERLKPERELALELGVSRRVLREALDKLEAEQRIVRAPGRGTIVVDVSAFPVEQSSGALPIPDDSLNLSNTVVFGSSPLDLMDARFVLEPAIAEAAAMHASTQDINKMYELLELGRQAKDYQEWERWDSALHQCIGEATHNRLLQYFYEVLTKARSQTEWGRLRQLSLNPKNQKIYSDQHANILKAIQARSPKEAAHCMRLHLSAVKRSLVEGLDLEVSHSQT